MIDTNQNDKKNEEIKLSPLGTEEINSVIKSFKESTFNKEDLYNNDTKSFVKKSLFDLAKEVENKNSIEENNSNPTVPETSPTKSNSFQEEELEKNNEKKDKVDLKKVTENNDENINLLNETDKINLNKKANQHDKFDKEKIEKVGAEINNKELDISSDNADTEEKHDEHDKFDKEKIEKVGAEINNKELDISSDNADTKEKHDEHEKFEEKTLEALDSVREAVSKSLDENLETSVQNHISKTNENALMENSNNLIVEIETLNKLFKNIREISNDEIENVVKLKVIELAESVIGYEVEKFPDKFLKKIRNSINEIKNINTDVEIFLGQDDLKIIENFISKNQVDFNFKLNADPSLGRGDFTIDLGGLVQSIKHKKIIE